MDGHRRVIGIDSSGLVASVAIVEGDVLLAERTTNYRRTHSETLLPMLAQMTEELELDLGAVCAVAVASGPGSFTGLRIGAATAKGLGLALDIPVVPVPTLEGLAYGLWGTEALICPILDARRGQVYAAAYRFEPAREYRLCTVLDKQATDLRAWLERVAERLEAGGEAQRAIFLGDGVPVFAEAIRERLGERAVFAPAHRSRQSAAGIAVLGARYFAEGRAVCPDDFAPEYLRVSQAEREGAKRFEV